MVDFGRTSFILYDESKIQVIQYSVESKNKLERVHTIFNRVTYFINFIIIMYVFLLTILSESKYFFPYSVILTVFFILSIILFRSKRDNLVKQYKFILSDSMNITQNHVFYFDHFGYNVSSYSIEGKIYPNLDDYYEVNPNDEIVGAGVLLLSRNGFERNLCNMKEKLSIEGYNPEFIRYLDYLDPVDWTNEMPIPILISKSSKLYPIIDIQFYYDRYKNGFDFEYCYTIVKRISRSYDLDKINHQFANSKFDLICDLGVITHNFSWPKTIVLKYSNKNTREIYYMDGQWIIRTRSGKM